MVQWHAQIVLLVIFHFREVGPALNVLLDNLHLLLGNLAAQNAQQDKIQKLNLQPAQIAVQDITLMKEVETVRNAQ